MGEIARASGGFFDPLICTPMPTAEKILIVAGVLNLALAFLLGVILSYDRLKESEVDRHYLLQAHRAALWEGLCSSGSSSR